MAFWYASWRDSPPHQLMLRDTSPSAGAVETAADEAAVVEVLLPPQTASMPAEMSIRSN